MKRIVMLLVLILVPVTGFSQTSANLFPPVKLDPYAGMEIKGFEISQDPISRFALSINPLGFIQFGPLVNAELGIKEDLVINAHVRVPTLGILTYLIRAHSDGLEELSEFAFGGGLIKFFGENQHKPYAGILLEYGWYHAEFGWGEPWEWYKDEGYVVFVFNGGYRFRFEQGFFINTGAFLGAGIGAYDWEYTDLSYGASDNEPRSGTGVTPFGMLEVTFGKEF